jgi:hypothetical protein
MVYKHIEILLLDKTKGALRADQKAENDFAWAFNP